ncbi:MAG TPA: hypothetical protein VK975_04205 [Acidimicrobiales bacterium]|nr:hypothetical protein [Acidimicrobiales bacterium]
MSDDVPEQERLQQVQDDIDSARKNAVDADVLVDPEEPQFHESGDQDTGVDDDQTIAPPG